jgi:parallel beta-helix repeat protein
MKTRMMMTKQRNLIITISFIMVISAFFGHTVMAADFYLSPSGDDSNPGTLAKPWKSIGKANSTLQAGDTVYIRSGLYPGRIEPSNSGQAGKRVTYKNYLNESATITGDNGEGNVVNLSASTNYVTIDGLNTKRPGYTSGEGDVYSITIFGSYNEIKNCQLINTGDPIAQSKAGSKESGILISGGKYNLIQGNQINGMSKQGIKLKGTPQYNRIIDNTITNNYSDSIRIDSAKGIIQGNLIENNHLGGSLTSDGIQFDGDYSLSATELETDTSNRGTIIRNNRIYDNAENAIDLKGTSNIVIESNYIYGNIGDNDGFVGDNVYDRNTGPSIHKGHSAGSSRDVIIRNNIIVDNTSGILLQNQWVIYNNTIIGNNRDYTGHNSTYTLGNGIAPFNSISGSTTVQAIVKNNIMGDSKGPEISFSTGSRIELDGNVYFSHFGNPTLAVFAGDTWTIYTFNDWNKALGALSTIYGKDANSKVVSDPMFVNVPPRPLGSDNSLDFHLTANSPAIDAGAPLTTTTTSGAGTKISLKNSKYFYDGFGVTEGDLIVIGQNDPVQIIAINYDSHIVTVDRTISWTSNQPVNRPYSGSGPDAGALEYSTSHAIPASPSGLQLKILN